MLCQIRKFTLSVNPGLTGYSYLIMLFQSAMRVLFAPGPLEQLETDPKFTGGHSAELVRVYRKRMTYIRQAKDERDLYGLKSLRFEKLKGARSHQRSIRLNDQWRLILQLDGDGEAKTVLICSIEDYHS
jgi:proteic killer suppression protein